MPRRISTLCLLLLGLAGCAVQPPQATAPNELPGLAPGMARVFFYRDKDYAESGAVSHLYMNKQEVGYIWRGNVIYRDVAPGDYEISVSSDLAFPRQFKTARIEAGQTRYVKIESLMSWGGTGKRGIPTDLATYVVALIDPDQAREEITHLR